MPDSPARYAVVGRPVLHSRSPQLFKEAFSRNGMNAVYLRLCTKSAAEVIRLAGVLDLSGFNVTSPFKESIVGFLDSCDATAARIGAVNTVVRKDGGYHGFNTDWIGVLAALRKGGIEPTGAKAVVVGAGGAARAAAWGLSGAGARDVVMVNRTLSRAKQGASAAGCRWVPAGDLQRELESAQLMVVCLPPGTGFSPEPRLDRNLAVLDANYRDGYWEKRARQSGCKVVSGMDWLAAQAEGAFELLTGRAFPHRDPGCDQNREAPASQDCKKNIALIGFMGAGKSTVGRLLAKRLGLVFFDSDQAVEETSGRSIESYFRAGEENGFRRVEACVLQNALTGRRKVIACGGGALMDFQVREQLGRACVNIWLWAPAEVLLSRVGDGSRPLLAVDDPLTRARELLGERNPVYAEAADLVTDADQEEPAEVAEKIEHEIRISI